MKDYEYTYLSNLYNSLYRLSDISIKELYDNQDTSKYTLEFSENIYFLKNQVLKTLLKENRELRNEK